MAITSIIKIMVKNRNKSFTGGILCAFFALCGFLSACKTEYVPKELVGDNFIETFTLREFSKDTLINASIVGGEVIVYWPSYKPLPDSIRPTISLSENASIRPASGTLVPFRTGTTYTVTSEADTEKEYVLKVDLRQPIPGFAYTGPNIGLNQGDIYDIYGHWFLKDIDQIRAFFVDTVTREESPFRILGFREHQKNYPEMVPYGFISHEDVSSGKYHLKVVNGIHTVFATVSGTAEKVVFTIAPTPRTRPQTRNLLSSFPYTLRRGEEFTMGGKCLDYLTNISLQNSLGQKHEVEFVRSSYDSWTGKIPADMPLGEYKNYYMIYQEEVDGVPATKETRLIGTFTIVE